MLICALVGYPLLDGLAGFSWRQWRLFGVAPGPTALFTLGVILLAECRARVILAVIPVLWVVIEAWSARVVGVSLDIVPVMVAGIALPTLLRPRRLPGEGAEA